MTDTTMPATGAPTPDRIQIGSQRLRAVMGMLFCFGFVGLGLWLLLYHGNDPRAVVGLVCALFFAWLAWVMVLRFVRDYRTTIGPEGVTVPGPTFVPKTISWNDIEAVTAFKIKNSGYTGFRLKSCERLISQYSPDESRILLRRYRLLGSKAAQGATDLASLFAGIRRLYGCEVYLAAIDRDRNAEDFAAYLEGFRRKYAHAAAPHIESVAHA